MKISQCVIVRDEEENIKKCLKHLTGLVDEQIVVDTGSKDATKNIAARMGAKVFDFEWIDDFSAAKNFALSKATGDWIVFLDADEYFDRPESLHKIVHNYRDVDVIQTPLINIGDDGEELSKGVTVRIFKNKPSIKFERKIHEALMKQKGELLIRSSSDIAVYHTGYANKEIQRKNTYKRNMDILMKSGDMDDPLSIFYIANSLSEGGSTSNKEAQFYYRKVLEHKDTSSRELIIRTYQELMFCILSDPDEADDIPEIYKNAISYEAGFPDFEYIYGKYLLNNENYSQMRIHFEKTLEYLDSYRGLGDIHILKLLPLVYKALWIEAFNSGDHERIFKYSHSVLRENKYDMNMLIQVINVICSPKDGMELLSRIYDFREIVKDRLFVYKAALVAGKNGLADEIMVYFSPAEQNLIADWR